MENPSTSHLSICTDLIAERISSQKLESPSTLQITKFSISPNLHTEKSIKQTTSCFQGLEEHSFHSDLTNNDTENFPISIFSNVFRSIENEQIPKQVHCIKSQSKISRDILMMQIIKTFSLLCYIYNIFNFILLLF